MYVIDRRRNPQGRSIGNRQRFIRRAREQIREAIRETLRERKIEDVASGEDVVISSDGIHEPRFTRDRRRVITNVSCPATRNTLKATAFRSRKAAVRKAAKRARTETARTASPSP